MSTRATIAFFACLASCTAPRAKPDLAPPMGRLGFPIGSFLRIEGVRAERGKVGDQSLSVDRVGGRALADTVEIWVENLAFTAGERCALSGYETGRWIGLPPEVQAAEHLAPHQALWQFHRTFIATSVQAPPTLVQKFGGDAPRR